MPESQLHEKIIQEIYSAPEKFFSGKIIFCEKSFRLGSSIFDLIVISERDDNKADDVYLVEVQLREEKRKIKKMQEVIPKVEKFLDNPSKKVKCLLLTRRVVPLLQTETCEHCGMTTIPNEKIIIINAEKHYVFKDLFKTGKGDF